jgi:hypothetical protein
LGHVDPWCLGLDETETALDPINPLVEMIKAVLDARQIVTHQGKVALHHGELILKRGNASHNNIKLSLDAIEAAVDPPQILEYEIGRLIRHLGPQYTRAFGSI